MKKLLVITLAVFCCVLSSANKKDWGYVSASLESLNHFYVEDARNNFFPSTVRQLTGKGIYATNDYLKADYYKGRFSAGLQLEGYFPATVGYPMAQNKLSLSNVYASWKDKSYSVTLGSFYDQLGSGLLFRSWEDRTLGLNNAMLGARATYNFRNYLSLKAFWGIPRIGKIRLGDIYPYEYEAGFFGLGLTKVNIAALDLSLSLSDIIGWDKFSLSLEGSVINKHEKLDEYLINLGCPENNIGWSARVNMDVDGFYLKGEWVDAGKPYLQGVVENGNAQLLELGYNNKGLGVSLTGRRLYRMSQPIYNDHEQCEQAVNLMAYSPALCTQYTYMLTTLNPYIANPDGEIGGQLDAFYNVRRGTALGGKRGMKLHANFSAYWALAYGGAIKGSRFEFWDFSFDVEKQWTKKFKTTLLYSAFNYDHATTTLDGTIVNVGLSHTIVADLLYKWTPQLSTRLELQYQATDGYQGDWMAALLEVSLAPNWSIFASDMYNHGSSKMHYYNAGISYAMRYLRVALGYGRYRAGYICSGGQCRETPAYTGANLTLTASF